MSFGCLCMSISRIYIHMLLAQCRLVVDLAVRRSSGAGALFPRGARVQEGGHASLVQRYRQLLAKESHESGRGVDGRVQRVVLHEDRLQSGPSVRLSVHLSHSL